MSKRKDGVFSLLRHIIGNQKKIIKEQEKQTKMLQAIESNEDLEVIGFSVTTDTDELLANIDFESNEVITFGGYKVIEHTKKEPVLFKELVQTD